MIRRTHRSRPWFGAVAALLLLALPVHADDIEPEPYVEEHPAPEPAPQPAPEPEPVPVVAPQKEAVTKTATAASSGPSVGAKIFDCAVLRPLGFVATVVGGVFFVPAAALASGALFVPPMALDSASANEGVRAAWAHFVAAPVENTFKRPLGDF